MSVTTAVIGLGDVAERIHLPACRAVPELEVVAGCEPDGRRRARIQRGFGLPRVYAQADELLDRERPQLVIVGTPPDTHKELCLLALRRGADVLCEKPFMPTAGDADEVVAEARRLERVLAVNTQYRFMRIYRAAREAIGGKEVGGLFFVQCWQQMYHPPGDDPKPWRASLERATLFEFAPHVIDLLSFFFDARPSSIRADLPHIEGAAKADALVHLTLQFPRERLATVVLNRLSHAPERYLEMRLDCERASLRVSLGGVARAGLQVARHRGHRRIVSRFSWARGGEARIESAARSRVLAREPQPAFATATARHLEALLRHRASSGEDRFEPAEHARFLSHVIDAGYRSAATHETITL